MKGKSSMRAAGLVAGALAVAIAGIAWQGDATRGAGMALAVGEDSQAAKPASWEDSITTWRAERETRLKGEAGWLSVSGLFWLKPGENAFGTSKENTIVLPNESAPENAGVFRYEPAGAASSGGAAAVTSVLVEARPGVELFVGDSLVTKRALRTDADGQPDVVKVGRLQLTAIHRGDRDAIRMRDPESPLRKAFEGLDWFAIDPACRLEAKYQAFREPLKLAVPNIAGYADTMLAPGIVSFVLGGNHLQLTPVIETPADSSFWFIFADATTELETYGGGRFLYADLRPDGTLDLDFNRAYNPPCAFTPYTTCPMPPDGNRLPIAVRAGEKKYEGADH